MEEIKQFIEEHIPKMDSPQKVYQLFEGLGYKTLDSSFRGKEAFGLREKDREAVKDIYIIANYQKRFQIFLVELTQPSTAIIKNLPLYFERETQYPFFILTPDYRQYTFVLVEKIREDVGEWKRKTIRLNLDRENAYYTDKWILSEIAIKDEEDPIRIYNILKQSFNVEKVTNKFFNEYIQTFSAVKGHFLKQTKDQKSAHDFTQQLLNRIMFIYFVAKKRWLGNDLKFMTTFWDIYCKGKKKGEYEPDTFYDDWLSVLFFEAFNNRFAPRRYFPDELNKTLLLAPYLNGGLFTRNRLDDIGFLVKDSIFEMIFTFLNRYNFTIREELPLEEEVAVDPEMIGRVYESLVNLSEEEGERYVPGIFYTDRVEIDFMSRRSLVEYFYNQLQVENVSKEIIYKFIFAKSDDEKKEAEKELNKLKIWERMEESLDNLSVVDPACGSGSFLVGMLNILADLYKLTYKNLNRPIDDFEIKKQIIGRSLYGVDVMEWAVHVAELRLWLQLIVESELSLGELKVKPLLPNLTFKLRPGDSLVQEIGGVNLALRNNKDISSALKRKLTELKQEKLKFYNNDPSRKFKTEELILHEELNIFRAILDERIQSLTNKIKEKQRSIGKKEEKELFKLEEITTVKSRQQSLEILEQMDKKTEEEIERLTQEKERLIEIRSTLDKETKPFVWDIDFVEIFADEFEGGFDIVIGNPPYVRQEKIADPKLPKGKITNENKKEYKEKLFCSVQNHFPFIKSLDKKSDLYIYFYFHGLALLNQTGVFCFITSNSWLDVDYGKGLQEFLLNNVKIYAIHDNSAKRSFARADINTIIAVFSVPKIKEKKENLENLAKFVMFKKSFDDVLTIDNLLKIEEAREIMKTNDFRVYPKRQVELLEQGWEYPEDITEEQQKIYKFNIGKYEGNKWGGKYLRVPDVYLKLLDMHSAFVPLVAYADIRYGLKTGLTEFFYFDLQKQTEWNIENKFLIPFVTSTQELENYVIDPKKTQIRLFVCSETKSELRRNKKNALKYIEWGEKQKTKKGAAHTKAGIPFPEVPSVKGNSPWYSIKYKKHSDFAMSALVRERYFFATNPFSVLVSNMFYQGTIKNTQLKTVILAGLNSTITYFFQELLGRPNIGGRLNFYAPEFKQLIIPNPELLLKSEKNIREAFEKLSRTEIDALSHELIKHERIILDEIIRISLNIPKDLWSEMCTTFKDIINKRISKEQSL